MAKFNYLTEEHVMEIFSWLPANSLTRFKCLSKTWYSLIQNHHFVAKQLQNHVRSASHNNLCVLLQRRIISESSHPRFGENVLSFLTYDDNMMQAPSGGDDFPFLVKPVSFPFYNGCQFSEILGNCDGIVFFHDHCYSREMVAIANLGTREYRILPKSCICLPPLPPNPDDGNYGDDHFERSLFFVGLGHDPKGNDYKVVRVWRIAHWDNSCIQRPPRVEVYTLSSDSWREIDNLIMEVEIDKVVMTICVFCSHHCFERYWNGAYYWYAVASDLFGNTKSIIVLFDMTYEVFRYIPMPESCHDISKGPVYYTYSLMELNGSLALFHYPYQVEETSFDIWAMDEFGVDGTWKKILCIGPVLGIERPLLFVKGGHLLMEGKGGQLVSYNLKTKHVKKLTIYGEALQYEAFFYKGSLVSVVHKGMK